MRSRFAAIVLLVLGLLTACATPQRSTAPTDEPSGESTAPAVEAPVETPPTPPPAPPTATVLPAADYDGGKQQRLGELVQAQPEAIDAAQAGYFLDVQQARLQQKLSTEIDLRRDGERFFLRLPNRLGFATGSAELRDEARAALRGLAEVLVEFRPTLVSIFGHTDNTGPTELNQHLSQQRALAVARFLLDAGVERNRLLVVGYGPSQPIADNATPEGRDANRRVELLLEPVVRH